MSHIFVRPVTPEDAGIFLKWAVENKGNEFDPDPVTYPDSFTLCAFDETGPLAYLPIQQPMFVEPMMLESFAPKPGLTPLQASAALRELIQACVTIGFMKGTGEMYFLGTNTATNSFAEKSKVFERLDWPVYRLRLSDLTKEEPNANQQ
jgi:hypothetical protein